MGNQIPDDITPNEMHVLLYAWRVEPGMSGIVPAAWSDFTGPYAISRVPLRRVQARLGCDEDAAAATLRDGSPSAENPDRREAVVAGVRYEVQLGTIEVDGVSEICGAILVAPEELTINRHLIERLQREMERAWQRAAAGRARA